MQQWGHSNAHPWAVAFNLSFTEDLSKCLRTQPHQCTKLCFPAGPFYPQIYFTKAVTTQSTIPTSRSICCKMDEEIPKGQGVVLFLICVYRRRKSLGKKGGICSSLQFFTTVTFQCYLNSKSTSFFTKSSALECFLPVLPHKVAWEHWQPQVLSCRIWFCENEELSWKE